MPAIVWPDVEALTVGYLRGALAARAEPYAAGVYVAREVPGPRTGVTPPARMVIVRDDGGPAIGDVRAVARLGIRVFGPDTGDSAAPPETTDLANLCVALIAAMPDGKPVVRVDVNRPAALPEESGRPLRYFTAELVIRGVSL